MTEDRIARARDALEPFAKVGGYMRHTPDIRSVDLFYNAVERDGLNSRGKARLTVADFHAAAEALAALASLPDDVSEERTEKPDATPMFKIGDKVIPDYDEPEPADPEWIFGVEWSAKHGWTYTTSPQWPPKHDGWHVCGLTDEWPEHKLSRATA